MTDNEIKDFIDALDGGQLNAENFGDQFKAILALDDEQFTMIAPSIIVNFRKSLNNTADLMLIAQTMNITGIKSEDAILAMDSIFEAIDQSDFSSAKRTFLKELIVSITNGIEQSEGISKRIIKIPVELCNENAKIPEYAHLTDSGMDVFAIEDITIAPGELKLIPTGIKVAIPNGYELQVRPKSGRSLKTRLRIANTPGTIDSKQEATQWAA